MQILKITHNAGFFSCFSKRLEAIIWFFNKNKRLPYLVDSQDQFSLFKSSPVQNLIPLFFKENEIKIEYKQHLDFYNDMQFLRYEQLDFSGLRPFIEKYFSPSQEVERVVSEYEKKYHIDYHNTCVVFYRGNDKFTETKVAGYETFLSKAREFKLNNPTIKFLVQTDEAEFLEIFLKEFPNSLFFAETPVMSKKKSTIHDELPLDDRAEHGKTFFAAILALSKCRHIITHSGNGALWCVLYRGNMQNVQQYLNNSWSKNKLTWRNLWYKNKRHIKKIFKEVSYWQVRES